MPRDLCERCMFSYTETAGSLAVGEEVYSVYCEKRNPVPGMRIPVNRHSKCSFFKQRRSAVTTTKCCR